jgi:hypothetical protein
MPKASRDRSLRTLAQKYMTTIREFTNQIEAALIQTLLKDNQIDSILADENARAWVGAQNLVPIRLQVPENQVEQAKALLTEFDNAPEGTDNEIDKQ